MCHKLTESLAIERVIRYGPNRFFVKRVSFSIARYMDTFPGKVVFIPKGVNYVSDFEAF